MFVVPIFFNDKAQKIHLYLVLQTIQEKPELLIAPYKRKLVAKQISYL